MGQNNQATQQEHGCFSPCIRDKNPTSPQPNRPSSNHTPHITHNQPPNKKQTHKKSITAPITLETSLEQRLRQSLNQNDSIGVENQQIMVAQAQKYQQKIGQNNISTAQDNHLGLQSRFSCNKKGFMGSGKTHFTRASTCEAIAVRGMSSEKEREVGTSETSANSKTVDSVHRKKVLLNKIQELKQKYYERELQIEIYQDQEEYQSKIQKIEHKEESYKPKQIKQVQDSLEYSRQANQPAEMSLTIRDDLELFSREQQRSPQLQKQNKKHHYDGNKSMHNRSMNRSHNKSINISQQSIENMVSFSQYSEQSLQEIREVDEEEEDYVSKLSKVEQQPRPNTYLSVSKVRSQTESHMKSKHSRNEDVPDIKEEEELEKDSLEKVRESRVAGLPSKNHKILLF